MQWKAELWSERFHKLIMRFHTLLQAFWCWIAATCLSLLLSLLAEFIRCISAFCLALPLLFWAEKLMRYILSDRSYNVSLINGKLIKWGQITISTTVNFNNIMGLSIVKFAANFVAVTAPGLKFRSEIEWKAFINLFEKSFLSTFMNHIHKSCVFLSWKQQFNWKSRSIHMRGVFMLILFCGFKKYVVADAGVRLCIFRNDRTLLLAIIQRALLFVWLPLGSDELYVVVGQGWQHVWSNVCVSRCQFVSTDPLTATVMSCVWAQGPPQVQRKRLHSDSLCLYCGLEQNCPFRCWWE